MSSLLGILSSHPIQYQAPWFRALAKETDLEVFFAHRVSAAEQGKAGFGVAFDWDVDLLSGYEHRFLQNVARHPGVNHFFGCDTPEIAEIILGQQDHETTGQQTEGRQDRETTDNKSIRGQKSVVSSESFRERVVQLSSGQRRFDAFIVTGWSLKSYWQAIRACRRAGVPVLVRGDSQLGTTRSGLKRAIKQITHRFALQQFDGFLSVGRRNREYLLHYGVPAEKIFFVPHFVDNDWFRENAEALRPSRLALRTSWNIPEDAFVPLFVGKFIKKKRPLDLIKAAQLLLTSNSSPLAPGPLPPKLHLLFVGSGELGAELRSNCNVVFDAEALGTSPLALRPSLPSASFGGFLNQTEISKAYVVADVLVLPSDGRETWGLVVNEAMACGLPAIVSDAVGCAPDLIAEDETGFTYRAGDAEMLGDCLYKTVQLRKQGRDFLACIHKKLLSYSVQAAASGTVNAVHKLTALRNSQGNS